MPQPKTIFNLRSVITYIKFKLRLPRDRDNMETTIELVRNSATLTGSNLWVLVTAIFTASLGLNVNSTAVIIGAMLISPLMGPIMAIGMGVAIHDFALVYRAIKNFLLAVGLSILASSLYFFISPLKVPGSELLARTSPTVYDVLIAIFGGLAGIVAGSSKLRQSNVIPGVAIATALMPPLCTVGFGIANLNPTYIFGAFYLFFINTVFISLATYIIVRVLHYPMVQELHGRRASQIRRTVTAVAIITLLPSIFLTYQIVKRYIFEERAKAFVLREVSENRRVIIKTNPEYNAGAQVIKLTILGAEIDSLELALLNHKLKDYGLGKARLEVQQGFGDVSRRGSIIGSINNSIEANSEAINNIYSELQRMRTTGNLSFFHDSMQVVLARELGSKVAGLRTFKLDPISFFDLQADSTRLGWAVELDFSRRLPVDEIGQVRTWLKEKLPCDTLIVRF